MKTTLFHFPLLGLTWIVGYLQSGSDLTHSRIITVIVIWVKYIMYIAAFKHIMSVPCLQWENNKIYILLHSSSTVLDCLILHRYIFTCSPITTNLTMLMFPSYLVDLRPPKSWKIYILHFTMFALYLFCSTQIMQKSKG